MDAFQLKLEDKIYDTLPDADYNLLVAKRRQSDKGFVVDDSGLGYEDLGEEEDWEVDVRAESSGDDDDHGDGAGAGDGRKSRKTKGKSSGAKFDLSSVLFSAYLKTNFSYWFRILSSLFASFTCFISSFLPSSIHYSIFPLCFPAISTTF